tara:strand:- start:8096 stop:8713 length:618 start_codon:yes stop_codon:yes gene_type:complete
MKMKNQFILYGLFSLLILTLGCKNGANPSEGMEEANTTKSQRVASEEKEESKSSWRENVKRLEQKKPLSKKEFTAWLPSSILNLKQDRLMINAHEDLATLNLNFVDGDTYFKINIIDGAGLRGAKMSAPAYKIASQNLDQETSTGYLKTVQKNEFIAKERYTKLTEEYNIQFFYNNRFFTTIRSNLDREQVWDNIMDLNFENLGK